MAATPDGGGYWLVGGDGGVFGFGDAGYYGSTGGRPLSTSIVGMTRSPDGKGYRLLGADTTTYGFGDYAAPAPPPPAPAPAPPKPSPTPPATTPTSTPVATVPQTTVIPRPTGRRALKVRVAIRWTWDRATTRLVGVTIGSFPGSTRLSLTCGGGGCPRHRTLTARGRRGLHRLLRELRGHRYLAGDVLTISLTATNYLPERAAIVFRWGRKPRVRLRRD